MKKIVTPTLGWVYRHTRSFLPRIFLLTFLEVVVSLAGVGLALVSKEVIDSATGQVGKQFLLSAVFLFAVIAVQLIAQSGVMALRIRISGKMTISLRNYMFTSLVRKNYKGISAYHSGDLLNRFSSDVEVIVTGVTNIIPNLLSILAQIIAGITALLLMEPLLAVLVLVLGILFPLCGRLLSKKYRRLHKAAHQTEGDTRSFFQESFANIVVIKSFISELPILRKLNDYMDKNYRIKIKRNFISIVINMGLYAFFTIGYYGVLVWGAGRIATGMITYGTLNAFLQLIMQLRSPLQSISGILPQYYSMLASAERLIELEDIPTEPEPLEKEDLQQLKDGFSTIEVENVAFAYDDELVLQNCDFTLNRGGITAIMGESGCGKSTFFKLLLGLYEPSGGSIKINGECTVNASTRGLFSYVPQGNMILSGTIRENITMCDDTVSEEDLCRVAKAACIYEHIASLPDGFDTVLSERGAGLSEGQIQRISIARALLTDAPILLLDEATSALDEATETSVLANIRSLTDKTVLFITHRNTSVSVCDHIIHADGKRYHTVK